MSGIVSTIQEIVRHELRNVRITEIGLVEAVYPHSADGDDDNYGCDIKLKNSGLQLKRVPIATGHIGTVAIPNVGDLVLVAFDRGDINQPIIIGRLYNDEDRPPLNNPDELIFQLPLAEPDNKTLKAAVRNIQSNGTPREILIEMAPQITVSINDGQVKATAGGTEMIIDQPNSSGGTVTIQTGRTKIVMNQDGDIQISAAGAMELAATGDLTLKGQNVNIEAQMGAKLKGGTEVEVKGQLGATVDGGVSATLKGVTTSIKGITSFSMG